MSPIVVSGNPDPAELAALLAVLAIVGDHPAVPAAESRPRPKPTWTRPGGYRPPTSWARRPTH